MVPMPGPYSLFKYLCAFECVPTQPCEFLCVCNEWHSNEPICIRRFVRIIYVYICVYASAMASLRTAHCNHFSSSLRFYCFFTFEMCAPLQSNRKYIQIPVFFFLEPSTRTQTNTVWFRIPSQGTLALGANKLFSRKGQSLNDVRSLNIFIFACTHQDHLAKCTFALAVCVLFRLWEACNQRNSTIDVIKQIPIAEQRESISKLLSSSTASFNQNVYYSNSTHSESIFET